VIRNREIDDAVKPLAYASVQLPSLASRKTLWVPSQNGNAATWLK
jgi:hypothetical protein